MNSTFTIHVTGDAGQDRFILIEEDAKKVPATRDVTVAAGAGFINQVLTALFAKSERISVNGSTTIVKSADPPESEYHVAASPPTVTRLKKLKVRKKDREGRVWIFERRSGSDADANHGFRPSRSRIDFAEIASPDETLAVIHDAGHGWSKECEAAKFSSAQEKWLKSLLASDTPVPKIIVNLKTLPELEAAEHGEFLFPRFRNKLWQFLHDNKERIAVVVSLSTLQDAGSVISRGLSWEQTVEDLTADMRQFPQLHALTQFRHLFIRVELVGVIHIENIAQFAARRLRGWVHFTPVIHGGSHGDPDLEGRIAGKNTVLIASLAQAIASHPERFGPDVSLGREDPFREAIRRGIVCTIKADRVGYEGKLFEKSAKPPKGDLGLALLNGCFVDAHQLIGNGRKLCDEEQVVVNPIPQYLFAGPLPGDARSRKRWRMLSGVLEEAPVHRINIAMAIVKGGLDRTLNRLWAADQTNGNKWETELWTVLTRPEQWNPQDRAPDYVTLEEQDRPAMPERFSRERPSINGHIDKPFEFNVPITTFGLLKIAEREEIESFCSIGNLFTSYLRQPQRWKKPISIAVFGPPGTGKSFAVDEISKHASSGDEIKSYKYNVAQFRGVDDLQRALETVRKEREQNEKNGKTSLVFFDEFDCSFGVQKHGWLKYFLAPMQDGVFYGTTDMIEIGRAILVFAGGIYPSFESFDPRSNLPDPTSGLEISDELTVRIKDFSDQKGPDFISRLRGHINIPAINTEGGRVKHLIRRAVALRGLLEKYEFIYDERKGYRIAAMAEPIIYALLTLDRYHHGIRSMEALLQMCSPLEGKQINIAALPSRSQLNMHVDADEFYVRLHRGRARAIAPDQNKELAAAPAQ
jgi:hypothetical protein